MVLHSDVRAIACRVREYILACIFLQSFIIREVNRVVAAHANTSTRRILLSDPETSCFSDTERTATSYVPVRNAERLIARSTRWDGDNDVSVTKFKVVSISRNGVCSLVADHGRRRDNLHESDDSPRGTEHMYPAGNVSIRESNFQ